MVAGPVAPASANGDEAAFIADTNAARESHGLPPLSVSWDLTSIARNWSAHMSATQTIAHNPNLTAQVQNWQSVGENVGAGPDEPTIERAFMSTTEHRGNILSSSYTQFGVGVVRDRSGRLWVTVDFRRPMNAGVSPVVHHWYPTANQSDRAVHVGPSPTTLLRARLRAAQVVLRRARPSDPVAETMTYVAVMTTLVR